MYVRPLIPMLFVYNYKNKLMKFFNEYVIMNKNVLYIHKLILRNWVYTMCPIRNEGITDKDEGTSLIRLLFILLILKADKSLCHYISSLAGRTKNDFLALVRLENGVGSVCFHIDVQTGKNSVLIFHIIFFRSLRYCGWNRPIRVYRRMQCQFPKYFC